MTSQARFNILTENLVGEKLEVIIQMCFINDYSLIKVYRGLCRPSSIDDSVRFLISLLNTRKYS